MSSLRNSLHRRNHKERSQLAHRSRLGILEKHKDYVLRARDYHSKQDRITRLRQKAAERNKDEFYFGMTRQRTERGVHVQDRGNVSLPVDIVKVLKSQDANYIRTMRTTNAKKIDRLKSQLSSLADLIKPLAPEDADADNILGEDDLAVLREAGIVPQPQKRRGKRKASSTHIVFAESGEQAHELASSSSNNAVTDHSDARDIEEDIEELGWKPVEGTLRRGNDKGKDRETDADFGRGTREVTSQHRMQLLKELSARLHRDKHLRYAERELEMQKLLMGKGASRKMSGVEKVEADVGDDEDSDEDRRPTKVDEKTWKPRVYKWRLERKR